MPGAHAEATLPRVLVVADVSAETSHGGAERVLVRHVHALRAAGMAVTVLSRQPQAGAPLRLEIMDGVEECRLPYDRDRGWRGLLQLMRGAWRWWRQHGADHDLVIAEQPFVMWALEKAGCRLPRMQVCHSFAYEEYTTRYGLGRNWRHALAAVMMRRLEGGVYRRASHVMVLSAYMRGRLGEAFGIARDVSVAGGGTDPVDETLSSARGDVRAELGWRGPVAVTLRTFVPRTGVDLLVQAAAICRYSRPDLRWVVMGTGPLLQPLQRLAGALGLDDRVEFTGYLPDEEVKKRLVAADLFMLPTRALEGFGLVTIEANACGLPVVATPVGANVEVIRSLPSPNRLAPDATPEALAQAVNEVVAGLDGDADVEGMRRGLRAAAGRYDWAHHDAVFLACVQGLKGLKGMQGIRG